MSRVEKIYRNAINSTSNVSFQDLCYLVEYVGFEKRRQKGTSHRIYKHPKIGDMQDAMINIQDDSGKAKSYQVEIALELIEKYNLLK